MDNVKSWVVQPWIALGPAPVLAGLAPHGRSPGARADKCERLESLDCQSRIELLFSAAMNGFSKSWVRARRRLRLPTSEGFAKLSDHARLPGRFFYRLMVAGGR